MLSFNLFSSRNSQNIDSFLHCGITLLLLFVISSCGRTSKNLTSEAKQSTVQSDSVNHIYSVFLVGDAGASSLEPRSQLLLSLELQLNKYGKNSAAIFLGDNIYPDGLPPEESTSRLSAEKRLLAQLKTVESYPGRIIFIPGNHDWHSSGEQGLQWIRRQEQYVESYLNRGNTFLPDSGYPGPVSINLVDTNEIGLENPFNIQLVAMDTQWWIHPHEKPLADNPEKEQQHKERLIEELSEIISSNSGNEVLVVGHHPLFSYGRHGGKFPLKTHFLPPVFGSLYVAYRNIWGYQQDVSGYSKLKSGLLKSFKEHDHLIYASGHEHSLQYISRSDGNNRQFYLVSGSASKSSYVRKKSDDPFTYKGKGFIAIHYFESRKKKIEFWNEDGELVFQKTINEEKRINNK